MDYKAWMQLLFISCFPCSRDATQNAFNFIRKCILFFSPSWQYCGFSESLFVLASQLSKVSLSTLPIFHKMLTRFPIHHLNDSKPWVYVVISQSDLLPWIVITVLYAISYNTGPCNHVLQMYIVTYTNRSSWFRSAVASSCQVKEHR